MNLQNVFDTVSKHLLKQKKRSLHSRNGCAYRGEGNMMCAVGCLIKDEYYDRRMESMSAFSDPVLACLRLSGVQITLLSEAMFLSDLQILHDHTDPKEWKDRLNIHAKNHGLEEIA